MPRAKSIKTSDKDLQASKEYWPGIIEQVITERVPFPNFKAALEDHSADEIKVVIDWKTAEEKLAALEQ